jgi:hypothetical protein
VCDAVVAPMVRGGRMPGPIAWSLVGGLIGAARYAAIFGGVLAYTQAPRLAWALLVPGLAFHTTFGVMSGWVSWQLARAMQRPPGAAPDHPSPPVLTKTAESEAK